MIFQGTNLANSATVLLARATWPNGSYVDQPSTSVIEYGVWNRDTGEETGSEYIESIGATIFNTLQTDSRWTADAIGYNIAVAIDGSFFPIEGNYRVEILLIPTAGSSITIAWDIQTAATFT